MGLLGRIENMMTEPALTMAGSSFVISGVVKEKITKYQMGGSFSCIVFEIPGSLENKKDFFQKLEKIFDRTGMVINLDTASLLLLPKSMDRELVAHRISKSFNAEQLMSFEADNPEKVISHIKSLF